jgi:hypothetical protein
LFTFCNQSDGKSHQESEGEEETELRMESELDGMPMSGGEGEGEDLDGVPLDGAALLKGAMKHSRPLPPPDEDLDGVPSKLYKLDMGCADLQKCHKMLFYIFFYTACKHASKNLRNY